jgi:hypothetical protein
MRGRAAFGGTAGGAVAPRTTQGRLAPAGFVPELALRALRAIERQLGRLPICEVGRKRSSSSGHQPSPHSTQQGIRATCSTLMLLSLGRLGRRLRRHETPPPRSRERGAGTAVQPPSPFRPRRLTHQSPCEACSCTPPGLRSRNLRELPLNQPSGARGSQEGRGFVRAGSQAARLSLTPNRPAPPQILCRAGRRASGVAAVCEVVGTRLYSTLVKRSMPGGTVAELASGAKSGPDGDGRRPLLSPSRRSRLGRLLPFSGPPRTRPLSLWASKLLRLLGHPC